MLLKTVVTLVLLALPASAVGYSYDTFYGWSADGSFYAYASSGTDMVDRPQVCLSDDKRGSSTWPKDLQRPEEGDDCIGVCDEIECEKAELAQLWVVPPRSARKGPHGETVAFKRVQQRVTVRVSLKGRLLGSQSFEFEEQDAQGLRVKDVYWRADGGVAAVILGYPDPRGEPADGWPAPRHLVVLPLGVGKDENTAKQANTRGFRLYGQKKYAEAVAAYRQAIAADDSYVQAHYNLACAAALLGDRDTLVSELEWLASSSDPLAAQKLEKGRSDVDLEAFRADPGVRKLLGLPGK